LKRAAQQIRIVSDADRDQTFDRARAMLASADVICFLGFAYHESNMAKLRLDCVRDMTKKEVYGTAYDVAGHRRDKLAHFFVNLHVPKVQLGPPRTDIVDFLEETGVLG
jgi:hypothetical protein